MADEVTGDLSDDVITKNVKRNIHLGNSDSEFTLVVSDKSKLSSEFGLHCISTIDELNERIANLSHALGKPSIFDQELLEDDSEERKEPAKDMVVQMEIKTQKLSIKPNVKKPLLVELHSFPGFDEEKLTPLPSTLEPLFILKAITRAKMDLRNKPSFKKTFLDFFHSTNSQAILQDAFWWYFCHKYQPAAEPQEKLFDRIAKNYTNLLVTWTGSKYQDKLFKDYADLMSQAVYSTFCHAFPTSYRQFNAEFRDDVLSLINLWMMGTKPAPRTWDKWNFEEIEPNGLRKAGTLKDDVEKENTLEMNLETISKQPSKVTRRSIIADDKTIGVLPFKVRRSSVAVVDKLNQRDSKELTKSGNSSSHLLKLASNSNSRSNFLKKKNTDSVENMMQQISSVLGLVEKTEKKNSCAAEGGPTFNKVVFNLYGRSPLVEHFLQSHRLLKDAGTSVLVQRTEIASLPPLCAETYQDVIDNVKTNSKRSFKKYHEVSSSQQKEYQELLRKHKMDSYNFSRCSEKLLSNPQEVRKLSELLRITDGKEEQEDVDNRSSKLRSLVMQAFGVDDEGL